MSPHAGLSQIQLAPRRWSIKIGAAEEHICVIWLHLDWILSYSVLSRLFEFPWHLVNWIPLETYELWNGSKLKCLRYNIRSMFLRNECFYTSMDWRAFHGADRLFSRAEVILRYSIIPLRSTVCKKSWGEINLYKKQTGTTMQKEQHPPGVAILKKCKSLLRS